MMIDQLRSRRGNHRRPRAPRPESRKAHRRLASLRHRRPWQALLLPIPRWWWIAASIIVGVGAVLLRFANLTELGFNSDEAVYGGQAASLAGVDGFAEKFSVFRAHPLLFQFTLSLIYRVAFIEMAGRVVAGVFGLLTIGATYLVGREIVGRRAGLVGATLLAVMPYHVIVSRQTLLESAMTLFFALTIWAFARYRTTRVWTWAAGLGVLGGLTFLSKEVGVVALGVVGLVVAVRGGYLVRHLVVGVVAFLATISPHLIASRLGGSSSGGAGWADYLIWQTSRPSNHPPTFYVANLLHYFSPLMLLLVVAGLILIAPKVRYEHGALLLVTWFLIPLAFFQIWKVKGYHYLLPIAPAAALLAAVALERIRGVRWLHADRTFAAVLAATLLVAGWSSATNGAVSQNYARVGNAGYAGIPGGREAALWLRDNTAEGSRVLGIGPSMGNVIRFYGDRETMALSISPNPTRTNPAYEAVRNPDYMLRWGLVEYLVYDIYSAQRTPHFANRLLDFVDRYGGEVVFEATAPRADEKGDYYDAPVIQIYRVQPVGTKPFEASS